MANAAHVDGLNTNGSQFRLDHCTWNGIRGNFRLDTVIGVIDHNHWIQYGNGGLFIYGSRWNGGVNGDSSWAAPTGYGSSQWLFLEDNTFDCLNPPSVLPITDAYAGARFVVRHNVIHDGYVTNHGTDSTGRARSCRAIDVYSNTFAGTNLNADVVGIRGGGLLFHDNSVSGYWGNLAQAGLKNFRSFYPFFYWGGADGTNLWDVNEPNAFFTGTAASSSTNLTVTVSGASWAPDQWVIRFA